ncbi:hypothetical protein SO802_012430 [Lithocarpus litseifolius]|uniref:Uncharacterized protein n=1 Tax=Lithocarpus litseifolius TaxID=425828 RepID=A0AAW2D5D9_9ROSI
MLKEASTRPRLKRRDHARVKKVREYLETVKDFDELISPQSLFLHFLRPEPSKHDDVGAAVLMAHEVISVDDLSPLGVRPSHELTSSHVHKVLGESLYILGKYLDYDGKLAKAQSKTKSLSTESKSLKDQITALIDKAMKVKDRLMILEKSNDTEKAFSKLEDKQIDEALSKVKKAGIEAMEKFMASDEYSDKLCDYYVEGSELFRKYLAKHHPELDFSDLDMKAIVNEVLSDHQSTEGVGEGGEMAAANKAIHVDPSSSTLP